MCNKYWLFWFNFDNDTCVAHWGWVEKCDFLFNLLQNILFEFFRPIRMKKACFSRTSVHKNFKNHLYPDPTWFSGPQTKYRPGKDLSHFRHGNLTPDRGIKCRNRTTKSTKSVFMSDITAKTMVPGFKRLPQRAYLGGYTSYFGSRTHFQLATFYALTETPEMYSTTSALLTWLAEGLIY